MATYDQASWEALYNELERLRRERNLAVEMLQSAERELAAAQEKVVALSRWFR